VVIDPQPERKKRVDKRMWMAIYGTEARELEL